MDKIFLKPTPREIIIRGSSKEGQTDVFAYDYYDDNGRRKLGGLYLVGNVKQGNDTDENSPDIAYVTNLVASLAKREYYSNTDLSPRDAFSATLKKINDVVEEFFKNKPLRVSVGIFAIAGDEIMISKLGKFKIILGRPASQGEDPRTVDILNNVDLFNKERVEEKEFSNIVSGKIAAGDKLFAYYPNRMVAAREKTLKADLLKTDGEQFAEKLHSIKDAKSNFDCGALHLSINEHKESAINTEKNVPMSASHKTRSQDRTLSMESEQEQESSISQPQQSVAKKIGANLAKTDIKDPEPEAAETEEKDDVPNIISTEFSLGRKPNPLLSSIMSPINMIRGLYRRNINLNPALTGKSGVKSKFVILSLVVGVLVVGAILIKTFIVIDPEQRRLNVVIDQVQRDLKLVRTKISQNDLIGARELLASSLSSIYTVGINNDKTRKTTEELYEVLDNIDNTVDVSPTLLESMPEEFNERVNVLNTYKDKGMALDIYENNLYIMTSDSILKISDINNNARTEPSVWLKTGTLPPQPTTIAVDGDIYVMNNSGVLSEYYKGEKVSDTDTFLISEIGDVLLTSKDSDKLFLVNKTLARIYELDKETKSLIRTLKVGSSEPFVDAYLYSTESGESLIITTPDGRIWEIK